MYTFMFSINPMCFQLIPYLLKLLNTFLVLLFSFISNYSGIPVPPHHRDGLGQMNEGPPST